MSIPEHEEYPLLLEVLAKDDGEPANDKEEEAPVAAEVEEEEEASAE
jgi:hypothetical protein